MTRNVLPQSTQNAYPIRAMLRTCLAILVTWLPVIAGGLAYLATGEGRPRLSESAESIIAGVAIWTTAVSGLVTRAMADPRIDELLSHIGLSSAPPLPRNENQ